MEKTIEDALEKLDKELTSEKESYVHPFRNLPNLASMTYGKQFQCKGKHQYRNDGFGNWVCQCGRNMKS